MSACAEQIFNGITNAHFICILGEAQAAGINISGNEGSASQDGITVAWAYDPTAQTLRIHCTSAPFFVPCGMINSKIHDIVDGCAS
jgi:hypothetical protein